MFKSKTGKMVTLKRLIFIVMLQLIALHAYIHRKPVAEKIWSERCTKNSVVLNDCNWCRCIKQRYDCKARVCDEIDMFGHFKDAIQEIDVGMEGHGSWRSRPQACTPGVQYRRGAVLCVCDEDGFWPNPVCRDLFQILHTVELTGQTQLSKNDSCSPTKLYLVGCNVCFCPSSGYLEPQMCTKKECQEDDPVIKANQTPGTNIVPGNSKHIDESSEIYVTCDPKFKYEFGCRHCDCLRNNRLLCRNCTILSDITLNERSDSNEPLHQSVRSKQKPKLKTDKECNGKKPYMVFAVDCNLCHCSISNRTFCTLRKCIRRSENLLSWFDVDNIKSLKANPIHLTEVAEPADDESCTPGTFFKRDCNICLCGKVENGVKYFICSSKMCNWRNAVRKGEHRKVIDEQTNNCVPGTYYEEYCMVCHCFVKNKVKFRICRLNVECVSDINTSLPDNIQLVSTLKEVDSLNGYCQPMRKYKKECSMCRCLHDGRTMECSSNRCKSGADENLSIVIVPVVVESGDICPKGYSYNLDCNLCFCLSNGNAVCTTSDCSKQNKIII